MSDDQFAKLSKQMQDMQSNMDGVRDEMHAEFKDVRSEMKEMRTDIKDLRSDMDRGFAARDDEFARLFGYMQAKFDEADAKHDKLVESVRGIYDLLDADIKRRETDEQERLFMSRQLGRHDGWIDQLAKTTKTKLVPER